LARGFIVPAEDAELAEGEKIFVVEFLYFEDLALLIGAGDADAERPFVGLGEVVGSAARVVEGLHGVEVGVGGTHGGRGGGLRWGRVWGWRRLG
jgi:hypothetical protein